jgi:tripartite-type tricarboxylate transporter receptor subunit TctC
MKNPLQLIQSSLTLSAVPSGSGAAAYPNKPLRIIVPGAAGGPGDIIARTIAPRLAEKLGQPVNVEANSNQNAGLKDGANSAPDGYTLIMGGGSYYINAVLYRKLPFDPVKDFTPVTLVASIANVLVVHPSVPVNTVGEFIAYAKANPGKLRYGSSGHGSPPHLAGEMFRVMSGVDIVHVPYKGHVAAGNALAEGRDLQVMFDAVPTAVPHLDAGDLKGLGVTTLKRLPTLPDMPTISESGVPGYELNPAMGVLAPAGTPEDIVLKLSTTIAAIMATDEVKMHLQRLGIDAISTTRDYFASYMQSQFDKWAKVVRDARIEIRDAP